MECDLVDLDFSESPPRCRAFVTTERDAYEKLHDFLLARIVRHVLLVANRLFRIFPGVTASSPGQQLS